MPSYGKVVGRFFTHQQIGDPVPLAGVITFTPSTFAKSGDTLYGAVTRRGYVVDGVLCSDPEGTQVGVDLLVPGVGVEPSAWTYAVQGRLGDREGRRSFLRSFIVVVSAAGVDLVDAAPVQANTGEWVTRGEPGVGVESISTEGGMIVFRLSDGQSTSIPVPGGVPGADGADGRGVVSILDDDGDGTATVTYTDGGTSELPLPAGPQGIAGEAGPAGPSGRSVVSITDVDGDGTATVLYSDDTTAQLPLPAGPAGKDGASAVVQDTGWRDITALATNGTLTPFSSNRLFIRRTGNLVTFNVHEYGYTATGTVNNWLVPPSGFKYSTGHMTQQRIQEFVNAFGVSTPTAQVYSYNNLSLVFQAFQGRTGYVYMQWITDDSWPASLPGSPV